MEYWTLFGSRPGEGRFRLFEVGIIYCGRIDRLRLRCDLCAWAVFYAGTALGCCFFWLLVIWLFECNRLDVKKAVDPVHLLVRILPP